MAVMTFLTDRELIDKLDIVQDVVEAAAIRIEMLRRELDLRNNDLRALLRPDDGDPFTAGWNAAINEILEK